jgi:hypothetical protein
MPVALVTVVRPHVCFRNAAEVGSSDCAFGCKVFRCSVCHTTAVVHNPTYGCRKTK